MEVDGEGCCVTDGEEDASVEFVNAGVVVGVAIVDRVGVIWVGFGVAVEVEVFGGEVGLGVGKGGIEGKLFAHSGSSAITLSMLYGAISG